MIDIAEVKSLLKGGIKKKIISKQVCFKPTELAYSVAILANSEYENGYIVIGVEKKENKYVINGLSGDFVLEGVLRKALNYLNYEPEIESCSTVIDDKTIYIVRVCKFKEKETISIKSDISEITDQFLQKLLLSCIKLQSMQLYKNSSEDECNDFVGALLESGGYRIKDQTRRGGSASGKESGEVDIFVENDYGFPFTIVEALILRSLDTNYLNTHIDKIYKYDTLGNQFNVCLSYVKVNDFAGFWRKYCEHATKYNYPVKLVELDFKLDECCPYTDIRFIRTSHERSGKLTHLFHIAIRM